MKDSELLHCFASKSDHAAFAELVQRHVDFVYAAALRHVGGDAHRAEDITQQVFIDLARKAAALTAHPSLLGWLYASTRFTAVNTIRSVQRQSVREKEAETMQETTTTAEPRWDEVRPLIDDAMQDLDECDRQTVLLRFFGQQKFTEIGEQLGMSENAAQKRADRALNLLSAALSRRGINSTSAALAIALSETLVAAPGTLAKSVTAAALVGCGGGASLVSFMSLAKVIAGIGVAGTAGFAWGTWTQQRSAVREIEQQRIAFDLRRNALETRVREESKRADLAEADTGKLLSAIEQARAKQVVQVQAPSPRREPATSDAGNFVPPDGAYITRPGDTGNRIATSNGLTLEQLRNLNPTTDWSRLMVGQQIRVR